MKRTRSTESTEVNITLEPVSKRGCFTGIESTHNGDLPLKTTVVDIIAARAKFEWFKFKSTWKMKRLQEFALIRKIIQDNMIIWTKDLKKDRDELLEKDVYVEFPDMNTDPTEEEWQEYYLSNALRYENDQNISEIEESFRRINTLEATMEKVYWALMAN